MTQISPPTNDVDGGKITAAGAALPTPTTDRVMSGVANLAQLLPTGTVLTYQALSPSFTNHGKCETSSSNQWLTAALVAVLAAVCIFFSFTDSVIGHHDGKLYYVVFLTVAFSDVGLQNCFFPDAGRNTQELLKNLPLGMAFLSSSVFIIFPTKRKGIGFNDTTPRQKGLLVIVLSGLVCADC
uniref:Uncharacterized protein n=1 Tax=Aegilops tauschii TaxID=37682 RepID=N1QX57_AEGTA